MRWIFVTGATSGIGRACARRLAEAGHGVIASGRNARALAQIESEAERDGLKLIPLSLDVTDQAEVANAARAAETITLGHGIDVLVNNAGYGQTGFLLELTREQIRNQFDVNLFSVLELTKALLPQLERNRGVVVNMGSIISRVAIPWVGLYGTVKHALRVMSDVMRLELQGAGIRVVLVEPGAIRTSFFDTAIAEQAGGAPEATAATAALRRRTGPRLGASLSQIYARAKLLLAEAGYRPFLLFPPVGPERVAAVILRIVQARTNRRRFVVPPGAGILLSLLRLVPGSILDRFKRQAFHLT